MTNTTPLTSSQVHESFYQATHAGTVDAKTATTILVDVGGPSPGVEVPGQTWRDVGALHVELRRPTAASPWEYEGPLSLLDNELLDRAGLIPTPPAVPSTAALTQVFKENGNEGFGHVEVLNVQREGQGLLVHVRLRAPGSPQ